MYLTITSLTTDYFVIITGFQPLIHFPRNQKPFTSKSNVRGQLLLVLCVQPRFYLKSHAQNVLQH